MVSAAKPKTYSLSLPTFIMITSAVLISIRTFPLQALVGWQTIAFNGLAILLYLVPASLVSAELATGWPKEGGIYVWVKEAFGEQCGFVAIWLQWFQMTIGFIGILTFIAGTAAYLFNPALADSKLFIFAVVVAVWWGATLLNLQGLKTYARWTTLFVILGAFIPMIVLIGGGILYISTGHPVLIPLIPAAHDLVPQFSNAGDLVLLITFVFFFIGIEVSAAHANEMKNPNRDYPIAILIVGVVMAITSVIGGLIVAWIVPVKDLSLIAGIMQSFNVVFGPGLSWITPVVGVLIIVGAVGEVIAWVLGPVRGLSVAARDGLLPSVFQKENKQGVPTALMFLQAVLVTFWGAVFVALPGGVSAGFWALFALTTSVYIVMYFFMYAAAIRLRYTQPNTPRKFRIPGGKLGMWLMAGWGIVASAFIFVISLLPPTQVKEDPLPFELFMIIGTIVVCLIPVAIYRFRKANWKQSAIIPLPAT
ncbi:MAG: APC family permease [Mesorhizobium sp.]